MVRCWVAGWAGAVAMILGAAAGALAGPPPAARWVAPDAVVYVEMREPAVLLDRLNDGRLREFLKAVPAYEKAMASQPARQIRDVASLVADRLDTTWPEALRRLTAGGAVLAAEAPEGGKPRSFLAITPDDPAFLRKALDALLELARADASGKGQPDPIKTAEHRGVTGYEVGEGVLAIVDGSLVIAPDGDSLKAVIDRAQGDPDDDQRPSAWRARRAASKADDGMLAWGVADLERLREAEPKRFRIPETVDAGPQILFGPWIEALRRAPWITAGVSWTDCALAAELELPTPPGGYPEALKAFLPPEGEGAPAALDVPGRVASLRLWRDLEALWDVRAELLPAEAVQNLDKLDGVAGQFFGREFGPGVLGALGPHWQLVVARQDPKDLDPVPDTILPAFALVAELGPDDDEFAQRLMVAFQSFVGLANLGAAQKKQPPLMLGSEVVEGVTIATARYLPPAEPAPEGRPVPQRHNFSPSAARVGQHFLLGSGPGLTRDLVRTLRARPAGPPAEFTAVAEADGAGLAALVEQDRAALIARNMLEKGNDPAAAGAEIDTLAGLLRYLGRGTLSARDSAGSLRFRLDFALGAGWSDGR